MLNILIEFFSLLVIVVSIYGLYYFIGRMLAVPGRWDNTYNAHEAKSVFERYPDHSPTEQNVVGD